MTGVRRHGREKALQMLMSLESGGDPESVELAFWRDGGSPSLKTFANRLFRGAAAEITQADPLISGSLQNWKIERLSPVDRNVLRLAIYELRCCPDVPPRVVLNEYIEIARKFGESRSSSLVNGVLDAIYKQLQKTGEPQAAGGAAS
jgi:N utilization substance protein B